MSLQERPSHLQQTVTVQVHNIASCHQQLIWMLMLRLPSPTPATIQFLRLVPVKLNGVTNN